MYKCAFLSKNLAFQGCFIGFTETPAVFERNIIETCGLRRNVEKAPVHHIRSLKQKHHRVFYFCQACFLKIYLVPPLTPPQNFFNHVSLRAPVLATE